MNDPQPTSKELFARLNTLIQAVRSSDAYPAVIGGIAGGIAGAFIAALIASRATSRRSTATHTEPSAHSASATKPGLSLQDWAQLGVVLASLARQVQSLLKEQKNKPRRMIQNKGRPLGSPFIHLPRHAYRFCHCV